MMKRGIESDRNQDCTVYVGNLDEKVHDGLLYELFIQIAPIKNIHLPKDRILRTHQGYGFVEFKNVKDTEYAEKIMNGIKLYGKNLRVNRASNNASNNDKLDTGATLFIKNLDDLVDENLLQTIFKQFGVFFKPPVISRDEQGNSKHHGFIYYKTFKDSDNAIAKMNNQMILNKKVQIDYALKKKNGKAVKHGDQVERLLLNEAEKNNYNI
ncbi:Spliceosome-associated protein 49 [Wickerhamomyces ciferrii]|uniref:Spliceosome-associated protein 49 n=1 Tax=Wickerhamomyces ciferrii (strain ATCC 14091 / BCRC 22168 / CBS 111 / JCM 3599 / NBRC 0793 / NRRL Y-1031 F-60-10) TaxID=1206466 RepID=K0KWE2_WICCF|nr:Spliceosome-associated protein 49 [Wickerhamomyces ciferrii]CCH46282.1 Spliceosome-associated protein 49 [Wickerhamomyces ciferrii]